MIEQISPSGQASFRSRAKAQPKPPLSEHTAGTRNCARQAAAATWRDPQTGHLHLPLSNRLEALTGIREPTIRNKISAPGFRRANGDAFDLEIH